MSILQTQFATKHPDAANDLEEVLDEGRKLGATEGAKRLELICEQYTQLAPSTAYVWTDPNAIQVEIEEARLRTFGVELVHFLRNVLSLAPLIATWFALFWAVHTYQRDLFLNPGDKSVPFLDLWQRGFNGLTWFTFTVAAGLDVIFLSMYLLSILTAHQLERRAHNRAVEYVRKLQDKVEVLVKYVATEGIYHVGDQADIDKVTDAVKKVVTGASDAVKLYIDGANNASKTAMDNFEQSLKTLLADAQTSVTQAVDTSSQSLKTLLADAQISIKQVTDASTQAITDSNTKVENLYTQQVVPLMTDFHQDMKTLHTELGNYQGRLNDLTNASQELARASQGLTHASQILTDNADRYITIGEEIGAQIASLNTTQQEVLQEIQTVASGIITAAGNMTNATANMMTSTKAIGGVANQLDAGVKGAMQTMTDRVDQATRALLYVGPHLEQTAANLHSAAALLASIQRNASRFPWPFGRRGNQAGRPTA